MAYQFITMQRTGKILTIVLNRPPTNPLSGAFGRELFDAFTEAGRTEDVTVVVIASPLEKPFVAGADIQEMAPLERAGPAAVSGGAAGRGRDSGTRLAAWQCGGGADAFSVLGLFRRDGLLHGRRQVLHLDLLVGRGDPRDTDRHGEGDE